MSVPELVKPTIASAVRKAIEEDVFIRDSIERGYANLSAVARIVKPKVEAALGQKISPETVITSVKRSRLGYAEAYRRTLEVLAGSVVGVRTNVAELSVRRTPSTLEILKQVLTHYQEELVQISHSRSAVTIVIDEVVLRELRDMFRGKDLLESMGDLAAVTIQSPEEIVKTPGCVAAFYGQLFRRDVNVEDTVSCYTDTIMVVKMEASARAFSALTELISDAKNTVAHRYSKRRRI